MVKFIDVAPEDLDNVRESRRGRVSYPILKSFMEINKCLVQLDRTGLQQTLVSLTSSLTAYIRSHEMPIKLFQRHGELYLLRLDLNRDGTFNSTWRDDQSKLSGLEPVRIGATVVKERFEQEKGQTTK